jgi:Ca2+-binding EF-hand superfamily protein
MVDHYPSELLDHDLKTLVTNEFEASERHHLLKTRRMGVTSMDKQEDDRQGSKKKWRHHEFLLHRKELEKQHREKFFRKKDLAAEAERERQRMEEINQQILQKQKDEERKINKREAEAEMLGLESEKEVMLLRQRLAAAAYTDGGVNWKKLFHHFDRDNSNALTFEEFSKSLRREAKISEAVDDEANEEKSIFAANDGSKSISTKLFIDDKSLRKLFDAVDSSGNGLLELDEFERWLEYADDTWELEQKKLRLLAAIERRKGKKLTPEEEAAAEYKARAPFAGTEFVAADTMKTKADHTVHYGPSNELKIWYHRPSSKYLKGEDEDEESMKPETNTSSLITNSKKIRKNTPVKNQKQKGSATAEGKKSKNGKRRRKRGSRKSSHGSSRGSTRGSSRGSTRGSTQGTSTKGFSHDTTDIYDGDAAWFERRRRTLEKLDRWATATKYIAKESLKRRINDTEEIWNAATSKGHRCNLKNVRVERISRGYPTHTTMCAIEIQRAFRCYIQRRHIWCAKRIQKRWRNHLYCISLIRNSLLKIQNRYLQASINAWFVYVDKCKRGRAFLRKVMAKLRDKMFDSWKKYTKYAIEDRSQKQKKGTARFLKRKLYNCFQALSSWNIKMKKVRMMMKKRVRGLKGNMFKTWTEAYRQNLEQKRWTVKIQRWFRNLALTIKRRILYKKYVNAQATAIQARWRGVIVRVNIAATKIQSMFRVWKANIITFEIEEYYNQHEQIRQIIENGVTQRAFHIDAPRIAGAWLGRSEYMGTEQLFNSRSGTEQKRKKLRKIVLKQLADHLQTHFYLGNISKERAKGGISWALEHSVNIACNMFDPMLDGKFPCTRMRNVLCQLLGPDKRKIGSQNLTGKKECQELADSLDRNKTGYVDTERFKQWYIRIIGLKLGRPLIESQLTGEVEKVPKSPRYLSSSTELRIPAAEIAFFEAAKWLIRDHASEHFRASGRAVGREHAVESDDNMDKHTKKLSFSFNVLHHNHQPHNIKPRELYRTTMPRVVAKDPELHAKTFGTMKKLNEYKKLYKSKDDDVITELNNIKRPPPNSIIMVAYHWLMIKSPIQNRLRSDLLKIEDKIEEDQMNEGILEKGRFVDGLKNREKDKWNKNRKNMAAKEAARLKAKEAADNARKAALLAELDAPGKKHVSNDHTKPVRFMLKSFEEAHEYRAKWKSVDHRIGRNGKRMKAYRGICYASEKNANGLCSITINTPRVGTYRVDIEQRFGYTSKRNNNSINTGQNGKIASAVSRAMNSVEEETGKCAHRLRQIVKNSKWEAIAGSPKYIVAKYNVAASLQDDRPDNIVDSVDFDDDEEEDEEMRKIREHLLVTRTKSMPLGVGDFTKLGTLNIKSGQIIGRRNSWVKQKGMHGRME